MRKNLFTNLTKKQDARDNIVENTLKKQNNDITRQMGNISDKRDRLYNEFKNLRKKNNDIIIKLRENPDRGQLAGHTDRILDQADLINKQIQEYVSTIANDQNETIALAQLNDMRKTLQYQVKSFEEIFTKNKDYFNGRTQEQFNRRLAAYKFEKEKENIEVLEQKIHNIKKEESQPKSSEAWKNQADELQQIQTNLQTSIQGMSEALETLKKENSSNKSSTSNPDLTKMTNFYNQSTEKSNNIKKEINWAKRQYHRLAASDLYKDVSLTLKDEKMKSQIENILNIIEREYQSIPTFMVKNLLFPPERDLPNIQKTFQENLPKLEQAIQHIEQSDAIQELSSQGKKEQAQMRSDYQKYKKLQIQILQFPEKLSKHLEQHKTEQQEAIESIPERFDQINTNLKAAHHILKKYSDIKAELAQIDRIQPEELQDMHHEVKDLIKRLDPIVSKGHNNFKIFRIGNTDIMRVQIEDFKYAENFLAEQFGPVQKIQFRNKIESMEKICNDWRQIHSKDFADYADIDQLQKSIENLNKAIEERTEKEKLHEKEDTQIDDLLKALSKQDLRKEYRGSIKDFQSINKKCRQNLSEMEDKYFLQDPLDLNKLKDIRSTLSDMNKAANKTITKLDTNYKNMMNIRNNMNIPSPDITENMLLKELIKDFETMEEKTKKNLSTIRTYSGRIKPLLDTIEKDIENRESESQ